MYICFVAVIYHRDKVKECAEKILLSIVLCESQNENIFKSLSCLQTQWNDALEIAQHVFSYRWAILQGS